MRKFILIFLLLLLASSFAFAEEALVYISENQYYDTSRNDFIILIEGDLNGQKLYSNVANDMITVSRVVLSCLGEENLSVYRDGNDVTSEGIDNITEPGSYLVNYKKNDGSVLQILNFTILNRISGKLDRFTVPAGFSMMSVTKDGAELPFSNSGTDLTEEGEYHIETMCLATNIIYSLNLVVDHTPPTLLLSNVQNGIAKGPVDISDIEEDCSIYITLDGQRMNYKEILDSSGTYHIYVMDEAGNFTEYNFRIAVYMNLSSILFFVLAIGGAVSLLIYLLRSRNKLQIR